MNDRNDVRIVDDALVVTPRGWDKLWSFRRRVHIPLSSITKVETKLGSLGITVGWRFPGLDIGVKRAGTFHLAGRRQFLNVSGTGEILVIEVIPGEFCQEVYLSVANPDKTAVAIREAIRHRGRTSLSPR